MSFTGNKNLELPANGSYVGFWNVPMNGDMTIIDSALGGVATLTTLSGAYTLAVADYQPLILNVTGTLTANVTYTIPSGVGGQWIVSNQTTGAFTVTFTTGAVGGTTQIVNQGLQTLIASDGTDIWLVSPQAAAGSGRQVQFNNNGVLGASSSFVYDTSGNVGIGTGSPAGKLDISTGTTATAINSNNQTDTGFVLKYASALTSLGNNFNQPLAFLTNNTEKMRIDSSGNVGIGVSLPSTKTVINFTGGTSSYTNPLRLINVAGGASGCDIQFAGTYSATAPDNAFTAGSIGGLTTSGSSNGSGALIFKTQLNGTLSETMRIDSSGNVGIGTSSPGYVLDVNKNSATNSIRIGSYQDTSKQWLLDNTNGGFTINGSGATSSTFMVNVSGSEAMRIDSSGNLLVGTTTLPIASTRVGISGSSGTGVGVVSLVNTGASTKKWSTGPDANGNYVVFNDASAGMYIAYSGTSWTSSSDERLKTDLIPIENAASKVLSLRAVTGRYKTDEEGTSRAFLIAQDVQAVLPEAVDASDPDKLGVQYTDVIPLLVAAIQELSAKNDALEARLAKLETVQ
jgi:hypothetical protein